MEPRWYLCDVVDGFEVDVPEPDWSRVPAAKVALVRERFEAARREKAKPTRWHLWGPQIPWYQRQPQYVVTVVDDSPTRAHTETQGVVAVG